MGSEQIHFEALRKQMVIDRRNKLNIQKKMHTPPYQPFYVPYELPKDDTYFVYNQQVYYATPTIHQFTELRSSARAPHNFQHPQKFLSSEDIHGNSSASYRNKSSNTCYSAKIRNRLNNMDYKSQW